MERGSCKKERCMPQLVATRTEDLASRMGDYIKHRQQNKFIRGCLLLWPVKRDSMSCSQTQILGHHRKESSSNFWEEKGVRVRERQRERVHLIVLFQ
jgi:hypothetical protein